MGAGIAKDNYEITPYAGDQFRLAASAARRANLLSLMDGHGMIYTSTGHNLASQLLGQRVAAYAALQSETSLSMMPQLGAQFLKLPAATVFLDGEQLDLWGPEADGSQLFSLLGYAEGRYALVLETWVALVGVSTYGRAALPSFSAGVVSAGNKPGSQAFYRGGNLDAADGVPDQPFITGTLETQRPMQRQYRLRLIPDTNLVGSVAQMASPPDRSGTRYAGEGRVLTATVPQSPSCYEVAVDRTFTACKLALVEVTASGNTLHVNAPHLRRKADGAGQDPIQVLPPLAPYQRFVTCEVERLDVADALLAERMLRLEKLSDSAAFTAGEQAIQTGTDQRIFFTNELRDALGWHDNTTVSNRFVMDFAGSLQVICHANYGPGGAAGGLDGLRGLALYLGGQDAGIRVMSVALGGVGLSVQLTCEVDVKPGDVLEIAAPHTSETTALPLLSTRLTLRRTG